MALSRAARVGAVVQLKVEDYYMQDRRGWVRLHEKGGKRHDVPAHHNAQTYMDAYLEAAGLWDQKKTSLFRSVNRHKKIRPVQVGLFPFFEKNVP